LDEHLLVHWTSIKSQSFYDKFIETEKTENKKKRNVREHLNSLEPWSIMAISHDAF
jgi:hypothetical protein